MGTNMPAQCPECQHVDGKHRTGCKIKAAWDAVCIPMTAEDMEIVMRHERIHGKDDTWKRLD